MSHDLNRDPEIRELRKRFGDWMALVWLEMLSIADRNLGIIPGKPEETAEILGSISLSLRPGWAPNQVYTSFQLMADYGWIRLGLDRIEVLKSLKYHPSWEAEKSHAETGSLLVSKLVKDSSSKIRNKRGAKSGNGLEAFESFWSCYPRKIGKLAAKKSWDRISPDIDMTKRIMSSVEDQKQSEMWKKEQGRFIPHPSTWLNQGRWDDEVVRAETEEERWRKINAAIEERRKNEQRSKPD